jgi:beta-galactosidase
MVYLSRRIHALQTDPPVGPAGEAWMQRRVQVSFSDWTPQTTTAHDEDVEVYSNCEKVELFLNGKSLGSQPRPADDSPRTWKVTFVPGTLKAVGINRHEIVATYELHTAGKPARILLTADRDKVTSAWDDVSYLTATVVDENGVLVPDAGNLIHFNISGPGAIIAVDSADNSSHEPFQATERHAFQGQCFAILRASGSSGSIVVRASGPGLVDGNVTLQAVPLPASSQ